MHWSWPNEKKVLGDAVFYPLLSAAAGSRGADARADALREEIARARARAMATMTRKLHNFRVLGLGASAGELNALKAMTGDQAKQIGPTMRLLVR